MHLLNKAKDSNNDIGVCPGNQCEPRALASDARLEIVEVGFFLFLALYVVTGHLSPTHLFFKPSVCMGQPIRRGQL